MLFAFLPAALGRVLFLALHLSPSRFPQPLSPRQEAAAFAAMARGDAAARDTTICVWWRISPKSIMPPIPPRI